MHVNKLPLLHLSSLCCSSLRKELLRCCFISALRKPVSVQRYHLASIPAAVFKNSSCSTSCTNLLNPSYRCMSRYSASTIMRHNTKSFNFNNYDVIGFDLDGTVLRYNIGEMIPLEYELMCRYLVECKGYSNQLLGSLSNSVDKDFLQKGLFLDADRGNILKLGSDGRILKANHGTKALNDEQISATYGEKRKWSVSMQFIEDPLCAWNGPLAEKMRSVLDYFDISASLVFARAVDDVDSRNNNNQLQAYTVWSDILDALINIYTRENFSNGKSAYFEELKNYPDRYLLKTPPTVIGWLKDLKASNKKLFLLTGSHVDFANFTASYALGENWRDLFDVVVCFARKPGFFHASRPFHNIEGVNETNPIALDGDLQMNSVYSMGNWEQLQRLFAKELYKESSELKSLYIGDNLIQDVYAPAVLANIDSVAVSEEMLSEHLVDNAYNPENFEFKDIISSTYWNSYFSIENQFTLWTDIIAKYSKMCVPTLEHAACKPIDHEFSMENESGFYPAAPVVKQS